jgi:trimeric autotransporter adhesin
MLLLALLIKLMHMNAYAQSVAINEDGSLPNANAILDVKSFNKGALLPRTSTATRLLIPNTKGLIVYDTTTHSFWYNTGTAWQNLAGVPSSGAGWLVAGNSGTTATHFLGTTDSVQLKIKVNSQPSGLIDPLGNTFLGYKTHALNNPDNYSYNTGFGGFAMYKNNGSYNTAHGYKALYYNTASANTAVGTFSLLKNTTGYDNTAVGSVSLPDVTTGYYNTGVGSNALSSTNTGRRNTGIGAFATPLIGGYSNATAIGAEAIANFSNKVRIGNAAVAEIEGQVPFTTPSDGRFKFQVQEDIKGLDFINRLRPVTYNFDAKQFDLQLRSELKDFPKIDEELEAAYDASYAVRRSGFIAQEVEKAAADAGYNFSGLLKPKKDKDYYSLSYESFVPALVKAVQELNKKLEELKNENDVLKYEMKVLKLSIK